MLDKLSLFIKMPHFKNIFLKFHSKVTAKGQALREAGLCLPSRRQTENFRVHQQERDRNTDRRASSERAYCPGMYTASLHSTSAQPHATRRPECCARQNASIRGFTAKYFSKGGKAGREAGRFLDTTSV